MFRDFVLLILTLSEGRRTVSVPVSFSVFRRGVVSCLQSRVQRARAQRKRYADVNNNETEKILKA